MKKDTQTVATLLFSGTAPGKGSVMLTDGTGLVSLIYIMMEGWGDNVAELSSVIVRLKSRVPSMMCTPSDSSVISKLELVVCAGMVMVEVNVEYAAGRLTAVEEAELRSKLRVVL